MQIPAAHDVEERARDFVYTVVGLGVLTRMFLKMQIDQRLAKLRGGDKS